MGSARSFANRKRVAPLMRGPSPVTPNAQKTDAAAIPFGLRCHTLYAAFAAITIELLEA
jgi:hypothetical protein